jgi:hypothetical protein
MQINRNGMDKEMWLDVAFWWVLQTKCPFSSLWMEFCWVCLTVFPWEIAELYSINANNLQARKFQLVMLETVCVQLCVCGMLRLRPILGLT